MTMPPQDDEVAARTKRAHEFMRSKLKLLPKEDINPGISDFSIRFDAGHAAILPEPTCPSGTIRTIVLKKYRNLGVGADAFTHATTTLTLGFNNDGEFAPKEPLITIPFAAIRYFRYQNIELTFNEKGELASGDVPESEKGRSWRDIAAAAAKHWLGRGQ